VLYSDSFAAENLVGIVRYDYLWARHLFII